MPDTTTFTGNVRVNGSLYAASFARLFERTDFAQYPLAAYAIPWHVWRVWDAYQTNLPGTPAADDLGLVGGTFGTASPSLQTHDVGGDGAVALYARATLILPQEYDAGQTVTLRLHAGMLTTVSDGTATVDAVAYRSSGEAGIGSDLVLTAAQSINSLTLADKDFQIDPATLVPGDMLDLRIHVAINDAATVGVVKGIIGKASLLCDIKG